MPVLQFSTSSLDQTRQFGQQFARALQAGDVVALIGDLGAGKTYLTQAICVALGVPAEEVNSPTFVLIQEYEGQLPIFHLDVYRLADLDEFLELGADELLGGENLCLIEWADRVLEVLPDSRIELHLRNTGETSRSITLIAPAERLPQFRDVFGVEFQLGEI